VGERADERADDAAILAGLRRRCPESLTRLVEAQGSRLTRAAWLYLGDAEAAQDAAQEALIAAWDGAGRTTAGTVLGAWLMGILVNRCRKHVRTARRRRAREAAVMRERREAADAGEDEERLRRLQEAMERLSAEQRELIVLRFHEGMSVEETAAVLGIPGGTVKSRCHAAMARLRELMEAACERG
jgi:RNA polymerase sigma-70 factor, ECF subfamily